MAADRLTSRLAHALWQSAVGAMATFAAVCGGALLIGTFGDDVVGPSRQVVIDAGTVWPYALVGAGVIFVMRLVRGLLKIPFDGKAK